MLYILVYMYRNIIISNNSIGYSVTLYDIYVTVIIMTVCVYVYMYVTYTSGAPRTEYVVYIVVYMYYTCVYNTCV